MYLKSLEVTGFKSFARKTELTFTTPITSIVGPNGSGKSNVAEAFRFVLGEQSIKSLRGKKGEDMIFNGSTKLGRLNRASVKVAFDNSKRLLNVDFDEVVLERVVNRDSTNEYIVNGTQVRLKDIVELLAQAHIGPSGHHIISQGEADKILNANLKERREMIEEALGLKIYQYKRQESERKLEKTRENVDSVETIRKEIAPHLKFLKKQVEKIERAETLKIELVELYKEYFCREDAYLKHEKKRIDDEEREPKKRLHDLQKELEHAKKLLAESESRDTLSAKVIEYESKLRDIRKIKDGLGRSIGRLEGEIGSEERRLKSLKNTTTETLTEIPFNVVKIFIDDTDKILEKLEADNELTSVRQGIKTIRSDFKKFLSGNVQKSGTTLVAEIESILKTLSSEKAKLDTRHSDASKEEEKAFLLYEKVKKDIEVGQSSGREAERNIFRIQSEENNLSSRLRLIESSREKFKLEEEEFKREIHSAALLVGRAILDYESKEIRDKNGNILIASDFVSEPRQNQHDRLRTVERLKIRIEELGGLSGSDVLKEFKETEERDEFLEREIQDLQKTAESLKQLIDELTTRIDVEFKEGLRKINAEFEKFFKLMFGGGMAALNVLREKKRKKMRDEDLLSELSELEVPEEEEGEEGIDISVSLPHKKIKGLEVLSGGERALTSIALLFAVSQVNPPPFIILDETDAALDEANSRKYGDMIENLSKYSQLILITHNRETMSRAGVLYGVTMGSDGVSKLLSIQFEEAVKVAK